MKSAPQYSLLLLVLFQTCVSFSQEQKAVQRIDSLFKVISDYQLLNGALEISIKGNTVFKIALGYSDFPQKKLNTGGTCFALGSVSKVFTSTAILQLRDKGKFKLDDRFSKYFPEFPYQDITIRHLLSHTSGLPDYGIFEAAIREQPEKVITNADVIPYLRSWNQPLIFKPGDKWQYSNLNFCLLALLVEKVSGVSFEDFVREKVFVPAGMLNTYFYIGGDHRNQQALNYDYPLYLDTVPVNADSIKRVRWRTYNLNGLLGQGNIYSTTTDMLKFDQALYGNKLLKPETLQEAFTANRLNNGKSDISQTMLGLGSYGLGWYVLQDTTFGKVVYHTGGVPGAICMFVRNISKNQTIVVFDNAFSPDVFTIAKNTVSILNNRPVELIRKTITRDYACTLISRGIDAAFVRLSTLKADSLHYILSEDELNELGLQLLYAGKAIDHDVLALEVLKLNILLFPESFNTYDSYGEALAFTGRKHDAIEMYKKSIQLNPKNKGGVDALERLLK
jgi:CubicO group peptidase (beta-lactamase class C family)